MQRGKVSSPGSPELKLGESEFELWLSDSKDSASCMTLRSIFHCFTHSFLGVTIATFP